MKTKYTKELLVPIVKNSTTYSEVIKKLGLNRCGGTMSYIKKMIQYHNLDISHFKGKAWSKGLTKKTDKRIKKMSEALMCNESKLVEGVYYHSHRNKIRSEASEILGMVCKWCGITDKWNGKPITLHLDHIDGNTSNNVIENLRFLCPNCHSQTKTYCRGADPAG